MPNERVMKKMQLWSRAGVWVVAFALAAACGSKRGGETLHVVGHGPSGDVDEPRQALRISFDHPVVEQAQVGRALSSSPLQVSPKLALRAHWLDRQTLVATPDTAWQKATRYSVSLHGEVADRLAESFAYSFVHDPLDVVGVSGVELRWAPTNPSFKLTFDQEVQAEQVAERCKLVPRRALGSASGETKSEPVTLVAADAQQVALAIDLRTKSPLTQGRTYTLRCEAVPPAEGNAPLAKPYEVALAVYPSLKLSSTTPKDGERVTPDELTLGLTFSTPVDQAELKKHVRITPKHPTLRRDWLARKETTYELTATLEADTTYTMQIDGKLRDRFGQRLGESRTLTFVTTDASPSLIMENGIFAIEAGAKGYPVWSRNVDELTLECASVPKARIVTVLTSGISYGSWYDANQPDALDFRSLGLKAKKQQVATGSKKNKWARTDLSLSQRCGGGGGRGLFLAELRSPLVEARRKETGGTYPFRVLGNVTDLGVMLKVGPASGLVWVASLQTAQPVPGASISLYDASGHRVFGGSSDERGLLMLPGSDKLLAKDKSQGSDSDPYAESSDTYRDQRLVAIVEKDNDLAVVDGNWSDGIDAWNFNLNTDRSGGELATRGFIESDRGIYRPGETVHLKGLVREVPAAGEPRVPAARQIEVRVEDGSGAELLQQAYKLSEFGGFALDVPLDEGARTGDYYVTAKLEKQTFRQTFSVEEIRPVSFEITAPNLASDVRLGSTVKLGIEARYLFGAPVNGAHVHYEVERRRHWLYFPEHADYSFEDWSDGDWDPWWQPDHYGDFMSEGEGSTDDKGRYQLAFKDDVNELTGAQDYLVRTSVRDATDQEVTKRLSVTAHASDFHLGIASDSWVATVDKPFSVRVLAVDHGGRPLAAEAKLSIERIQQSCDEAGPYGYWSCERKRSLVGTRTLQLAAEVPRSEQLSLTEPGEHVVRVETRDKRGALIKASTSVWVIGPGESHWASDGSVRMSLIPSKRSYAPGDTAILVPEASTQGASMLVTIERNGILEARLEHTEGTAGIQVPISEAHAPNVFVSVAMIRGRRGEQDSERPEMKLGMVNLPVSFAQRELKVQVSTEGTDFQPGQTIRGKVRVLASDGSPVRAEVALSAADEGVLQLIAYQTPNPMDSFYAPWGLGVQTASSWNRVAKLQARPEEAGEEGADGSGSAQKDVRSRFVASAFWAPALLTDAQGEASFSFVAPDNLTAFRLMAAVADAGSRFGAAEQRVRVRKDLLIAPIVPRFLLADDQIELGAVVHNYTDKPGEVETSFDVEGVVPRKKTVRSKVAAHGKAVVRFAVKVQQAESATFKVSSTLLGVPAAADALLLTLPVERAVVKEAETVFAGRGTTAQAALEWHRGIDSKASSLEVLVDRTGIADLGPSLKYLVRYPYGCLEQTMSGFVPLLKVRELAKSLELPELLGDKLDTYSRLGVAKVIRHQHADGHFSLWPDSTSYPHLTVYAMWGLNEAKRAGLRVEKRALDLGLSALKSWSNDPGRKLAPGDETGTLAMASFVMAELGAPDPALHARLFAARSALPVYGKAFLARAIKRAKGSAADVQLLLTELASAVRVKDGLGEVVDPIAPESHYFSSESRSMAMVAAALLELSPGHAAIEPLVMGLKRRRQGGRWASTQENVYGLLALADYARAQSSGKAKVTVRAGDKNLLDSTLVGGAMGRIRLPLDALTRGAVLTFEASEPTYYSAVLHKVRPEPVAGELDHGFAIKRAYLDFSSGQPVTSVKVGDLVKVKLQITTRQGRSYVAISDPLPAGFESVNTNLTTERDVSDDESYRWFWDYRSLRDERTDWFVDSLGEGTRELDYVLRATHVGSFTVPPTQASEMYAESVMGHAHSDVLTVTR